jgi:hypothetical protein
VHRLQHRRLDLEVVARAQRLAQGRHDVAAHPQHPPRLVVDDQVDVPLPDPRLLGQRRRGVRRRQRVQALGGQPPGRGQHRQLARTGGDHLAGDADLVAEVDELLPLP